MQKIKICIFSLMGITVWQIHLVICTMHKLSCKAFRAHRLKFEHTYCFLADTEDAEVLLSTVQITAASWFTISCLKIFGKYKEAVQGQAPFPGPQFLVCPSNAFPSCSSTIWSICSFMCNFIISPVNCWREWKLPWITYQGTEGLVSLSALCGQSYFFLESWDKR